MISERNEAGDHMPMAEMTSKEWMLAALRRQEVDRVPVAQDFWTAGPPGQQFSWDTLDDQIA